MVNYTQIIDVSKLEDGCINVVYDKDLTRGFCEQRSSWNEKIKTLHLI